MSNTTFALSQPWFSLTSFARRLRHAILALELALQVRRERQMLASLNDRALKDIGLSRGDVHAEGVRSFWDVPVHRL